MSSESKAAEVESKAEAAFGAQLERSPALMQMVKWLGREHVWTIYALGYSQGALDAFDKAQELNHEAFRRAMQ